VKAIARHIRISPKKANLVAGLVRNKNAIDALAVLKYTPKKAAKILYKVIKSAISNASNNFKQKQEDLIIKEIIVTEGSTFKRSVPISRGRMHPILKRNSHITVIVGLPEQAKDLDKEAKDEKKSTKKKEKEGGAKAGSAKKILKKKEPRQGGILTTKS